MWIRDSLDSVYLCRVFVFLFIFFFFGLLCFFYIYICFFFFFFFSSRRRHTRYIGDWSSDVCSSDLSPPWVPCGSRACSGGNSSALALGCGRGWCSRRASDSLSKPRHCFPT